MAAERSSEEDEDGLFLSEELVQSPTHAAPQTGTIDFSGALQPPLSLHQDLSEGNGGQAWPAGVTLAKYLLRTKRDVLSTSSIVELGAGGGLVGLAIAIGCSPANVVHITDQQSMLPLMHRNIMLNGLEGKVAASVYDWGSDRPATIPDHPDVILAADCVYFEPAFPLLQQTLQELVGPQTTCYFCFKRRRRADAQFMRAVKKQFVVEDITDDPEREAYTRQNIFLCTIRKRPGS